VSGTYVPSDDERRSFAVLQRRLTPAAGKHRAYLRQVAAYVAECRVAAPRLAHDGRVGRITRLEVWRSRLFGRHYLVASVEASWYRAVAPASDAITSTLSGIGALPPLVIVPHRRRGQPTERFRSILEHEFVHLNQAMLGTLLPSPHGPPARRLAGVFFSRFRSEFEAHRLQVTRWPRLFPHQFGLSLEHWCVLRAYIDALEAVFLAAWRGQFRSRVLVAFLNRLPRHLPRWLNELGVDETLAPWFRRHLVLHVAVALLTLGRTRVSFGRSATLRTGRAWVRSTAWPEERRGRLPVLASLPASADALGSPHGRRGRRRLGVENRGVDDSHQLGPV
jgi:hypothetical protein